MSGGAVIPPEVGDGVIVEEFPSLQMRRKVILAGMTSRVGPKGQVVIPKVLRDQLGIVPGDEVDFALDDDGVRVAPVRERASLRGSLAGLGLTAELEADHGAEPDR
jgi:AbrB family looped-hinge helix DNA binding protein